MKKTILLSVACLLALVSFEAPSAFAADIIQSKAIFTLLSSAVSTATSSAVTDTGLYSKKTFFVNGMRTASSFGNYSGTLVWQGGPTVTGPWITLKDVGANATSATTNTVFTVDDMNRYVRATYTRGAGRGTKAISAWMFYGN